MTFLHFNPSVCVAPSLCFLQALMVHFEADTERRKLGLPHRVNFLGRSSLDPEYTQTEEVELHRQRHPVCTAAVFQLHVSEHSSRSSPFPHLWSDLMLNIHSFSVHAGGNPWQTASHFIGDNPHHQACPTTQTLSQEAGKAATCSEYLPLKYAALRGLKQIRIPGSLWSGFYLF